MSPVLTICKCGKVVPIKPCDTCKRETDRARNTQPHRKYHHTKQHRLIRNAAFARDGQQCVTCGSHDDLTLDYVIPEIQGGTRSLDNARTLCRSCNSKAGGGVRRHGNL